MKKVIFKGLGPTGNIVYEGKLIEDGAIIEMKKDIADAYIKSGLAYEIMDEQEAIKIQKQVLKNKERRDKVLKESENENKKKTTKKGGSK